MSGAEKSIVEASPSGLLFLAPAEGVPDDAPRPNQSSSIVLAASAVAGLLLVPGSSSSNLHDIDFTSKLYVGSNSSLITVFAITNTIESVL